MIKYCLMLTLAGSPMIIHPIAEAGDMKVKYKKPAIEQIKEKLTKEQFRITQKSGTEPAFKNEYWNHKDDGIYVDVVTGEPLFSSKDKYDSGSGWPSFTKPLEDKAVSLHTDKSLFMTRTEVKSQIGESHLGHVFDDGPRPTGKRYCINSAALKFIPVAKLEEKGYGQYLSLFNQKTQANKEDATLNDDSKYAYATFAGGCFWCMEPPFEQLDGVKEVLSGYMGGHKANPTYEEVSAGTTGHAEVVHVVYDPNKVDYDQLLDIFWMNINPTTPDGQFVDKGRQYRPEIFFHSQEQEQKAIASRDKMDKSGRFKEPIKTDITKAGEFYRAEEYHQDYYKKNPVRYKFYRYNSGRDQYLKSVWGKKNDS